METYLILKGKFERQIKKRFNFLLFCSFRPNKSHRGKVSYTPDCEDLE